MTGTVQAQAASGVAKEPTLVERGAWCWLAAGAVGWVLVPAAREYSLAIGWTVYWRVGAPLLVLATLHGQGLAARGKAILVGLAAPRDAVVAGAGCPFDRRQGWRHGMRHRAQARRLTPSSSIARLGLAALFIR